MSDIKLFRVDDGKAKELAGSALAIEKALQSLIERNLDAMLGIRFVASEHSTGKAHSGRIDTLGLDENGSPVILNTSAPRTRTSSTRGSSTLTGCLITGPSSRSWP